MFAYRLGPTRTAQLVAALHLAAAGVLLFGPGGLLLGSLAMAGVPARVLELFAHRFSLEAGRDGAACILLIALLWIGLGTWKRAVDGDLRVDFRVAVESSALAVACSVATAAGVLTGLLTVYPLWAFGIWLAALGRRIVRRRPAYPQALAAHRLILIVGLLLVWWGFCALIAAQEVDGLMAAASGIFAITNGFLLLSISAPMLVLMKTAAVRSALWCELERL